LIRLFLFYPGILYLLAFTAALLSTMRGVAVDLGLALNTRGRPKKNRQKCARLVAALFVPWRNRVGSPVLKFYTG